MYSSTCISVNVNTSVDVTVEVSSQPKSGSESESNLAGSFQPELDTLVPQHHLLAIFLRDDSIRIRRR